MTYRCKTCQQEKPETDFYACSKTRCKDCQREAVKNYRLQNVDKVRAKDRQRANLPHRVVARAAYAATDRGKERVAAAKRSWHKRHPVKRAAHIILGNAVRDGKVSKPTTCGRCGSGGRIHAHHDDYAKPLDVEWLCSPCHREHHKTND